MRSETAQIIGLNGKPLYVTSERKRELIADGWVDSATNRLRERQLIPLTDERMRPAETWITSHRSPTPDGPLHITTRQLLMC